MFQIENNIKETKNSREKKKKKKNTRNETIRYSCWTLFSGLNSVCLVVKCGKNRVEIQKEYEKSGDRESERE